MYQSLSLTSFIETWLNTFKSTTVKQSTYDRLQTSLKALEGFPIASKAIGDITAIDIQNYVNNLTQCGYGLSTIKKQMRIVTAPLKQAAALHWIPANPAVGITLPAKSNVKKDSQAVEAYSPDEQKALAAVLDSKDRRGFAAVALMIETGLRVGEALALRWRDIQLPRRRLTVRATVVRLANRKQSFVQDEAKSVSSNRVVPLTPAAVSLLEGLKADNDSEWVFTDERGERLSYEALRYQTKVACAAAGVAYRGMHVFRHTFATNCYYKGMDVKILSKLLGHADVNITYNIYVHLYGDGFEEMYSALVK